MRIRTIAVTLLLGWLWVGSCCSSARGDGGILRLRERKGPYDIAVFTAPTPFRAGPVDISVLVQDAVTNEPDSGARVTVTAAPRGRPGETIHKTATTEAATNKLLRAALFELPQPGWWEVEVAIKGGKGEEKVHFGLEADERSPKWVALWPWLGWPALAVVPYCLHQFLVWRKSRALGGTESGGRRFKRRLDGSADDGATLDEVSGSVYYKSRNGRRFGGAPETSR